MCLRIFVPTYRRLVVFLFFALLPLTGILNIMPPLQVFLSLPYVLLFNFYGVVIVQIIYSYVLACIYAAAYLWLEKNLRKHFPQMNITVKKKRPAGKTVKGRRK